MLKECNLGNVVTDAFVFHYANQTASDAKSTNASLAVQNSGSITSSIAVSVQGRNVLRKQSSPFVLLFRVNVNL